MAVVDESCKERISRVLAGLDPERVPACVALVLDEAQPDDRSHRPHALRGFAAELETLVSVLETATQAGVKRLVLCSCSAEDLLRPVPAKETLTTFLLKISEGAVPQLRGKGIRVRFFGRRDRLPAPAVGIIDRVERLTREGNRLDIYAALDYAGRSEVVDAARCLISSGIEPEGVDEAAFARQLSVPEVDLLILASGGRCIPNLLLWQMAYAEFYISDGPWPNFSAEELARALVAYAARSRRRGGV